MLFQLSVGSRTGAAMEEPLYDCRSVAQKPFVRVCLCVYEVWADQCYSRLSAALNTCYSWGGQWPWGPNGALIPPFLHFQIQRVVSVCLSVCPGAATATHTGDFCGLVWHLFICQMPNVRREISFPVQWVMHVHNGKMHQVQNMFIDTVLQCTFFRTSEVTLLVTIAIVFCWRLYDNKANQSAV